MNWTEKKTNVNIVSKQDYKKLQEHYLCGIKCLTAS